MSFPHWLSPFNVDAEHSGKNMAVEGKGRDLYVYPQCPTEAS